MPTKEPLTTPTMAEVLKLAIERRLADLHTAMPAEIVKYDFDLNLAQVKPHFHRKFTGSDQATPIPTISNVPVLMYRTEAAHFRLPVAKGDTGLLIFAERSLDAWIESGSDHDPKDPRKHALSDAVFVPGLFPKDRKMPKGSAASSVEIRNRTGFLDIQQSGAVRFGNQHEELIALLQDILSAISSLQVFVAGTDSEGDTIAITAGLAPGSSSQFSNLSSRMGKLRG